MKIYEIGVESKYGQMDQGMKDFGEKVSLVAKDGWYMLRVMYMMGSGWMIKPTGMEFIRIIMGANTRANGIKISSTAKVLRTGQMVQDTKANINKE